MPQDERMRYYPAVGPAIPHTEVGRSRVTHPFAGYPGLPPDPRDLHVLSTPPAFVLSQDQTLQWIVRYSSIGTTLSALSHRQRVRITYVVESNSPRLRPTRIGSTSPPRTSAISTSIVNQLLRRVCGSLSYYSDLLGFASALQAVFRTDRSRRRRPRPPALSTIARAPNTVPPCAGSSILTGQTSVCKWARHTGRARCHLAV